MARLISLTLLAALAVAEVAAVLALVDWLGAPMALLVLFLDVVAGIAVMRWGARSQPPARGWRIAAGAFIAIPGLVLDLVGLILLAPPMQRWISGNVLRGTEAAMRSRGVTVVTVTDATGVRRTTVVPVEVIPGQVVDGDAATGPRTTPGPHPPGARSPGAPDRPARGPTQAPGVVRGEIVGKDE